MKYLIIIIATIVFIVVLSKGFVLQQRLNDCHFEYNHLQTKLHRLQELNNYIPAMEQILNSLQLAELKALSEQIKQQKYKNYEAIEQPILNEKELKKLKR
jgi:hypothetical protein